MLVIELLSVIRSGFEFEVVRDLMVCFEEFGVDVELC